MAYNSQFSIQGQGSRSISYDSKPRCPPPQFQAPLLPPASPAHGFTGGRHHASVPPPGFVSQPPAVADSQSISRSTFQPAVSNSCCPDFAPQAPDGPLSSLCFKCGGHVSAHEPPTRDGCHPCCHDFASKKNEGPLKHWCANCGGHLDLHKGVRFNTAPTDVHQNSCFLRAPYGMTPGGGGHPGTGSPFATRPGAAAAHYDDPRAAGMASTPAQAYNAGVQQFTHPGRHPEMVNCHTKHIQPPASPSGRYQPAHVRCHESPHQQVHPHNAPFFK